VPIVPFLAQRDAALPRRENTAPCVVPENRPPSHGALVIVVLVLLLATALLLAGNPAAAVLGLLAGACYIGTEAAGRLTTAE
jgi:hypothetical protein